MSTSNEDIQLCARCGGQCCHTKPGIAAPEPFIVDGDLTASLTQSLVSHSWVLEEHLGIPYEQGEVSPDPHRVIRYPRPATIQEREQGTWSAQPGSGSCVFVTADGCQLTFNQRPRLCQELVPDVCFECESPWGRREAALAWLPWQEQVTAVLANLTPPGETAP